MRRLLQLSRETPASQPLCPSTKGSLTGRLLIPTLVQFRCIMVDRAELDIGKTTESLMLDLAWLLLVEILEMTSSSASESYPTYLCGSEVLIQLSL